jgi:hypothetical protein
MLFAGLAAAAQPTDTSAPEDSHPLPEVQVTASKLDRQTLNRVAMHFAKIHGATNPIIHQIGRWRMNVCPRVTGLQPAASAYILRRVTEVARSVGAPTPKGSKACKITSEFASVEIVFTADPQQLLNRVAKDYPVLLGSSRSAGDATFAHAIQSWYVTGTRQMDGWQPMIGLENVSAELEQELDASTPRGTIAPDGARVDPAYGEGFAGYGSVRGYFTKGLTSEILQVFIVVDSAKVAKDSMSSIADYIAMLALTRVSLLDGCSELPSIMDLLSSGCEDRQKPEALTESDTAYLKALYSSDLEQNLNLEQGELRDRMVTAITGR